MITIIDYNSGNIASVANALKRLGKDFLITSDKQEVKRAERVIFPGVGAAAYAMKNLEELKLTETIKALKVPFLGICLGMQILADYSEEGEVDCLGILPGLVRKFSCKGLKVPQVGWNKLIFTGDSPLFKGIDDNSYFYFVNSYYFEPKGNVCLGRSLYGERFCAAAQKGNFFATQFHPEKSGAQGLKLIDNFCKL